MKSKTFKKIVCLMSISTLFIVLNISDASAVRVSMKRIIFEGKSRSEVLTIVNNTSEAQTYRLGWRKYRMYEGASLTAIDDADDDGAVQWADDMLRFAPRRVSIPPGSSQQIRILLRRPSGIEDGEYRSHLWILTESRPSQFNVNDEEQGNTVKLSIQPAISLPIFVRHGNLESSAEISNTSMKRTPRGLKVNFSLNRLGDKSIYGDFSFTCKDGDANDKILHQVKGIAIYSEITRRDFDFNIPLKNTTCNKVSIEYRSDPRDVQFKGATITEATVSL